MERVELINEDVLKQLVSNERKGDCHLAFLLLLYFPRGLQLPLIFLHRLNERPALSVRGNIHAERVQRRTVTLLNRRCLIFNCVSCRVELRA